MTETADDYKRPLTTETGLRRALEYRGVRPLALTSADLKRMTSEEVAAYDEARITYLTGEIALIPGIRRAEQVLRRILKRNEGGVQGRGGLMISGHAYTGKTTTALWLAKTVYHDFWKHHDADAVLTPVVWVDVPPDPTPKTMGRLFHSFFEIPYSSATTSDELALQAQRQVERRRTRLIVVDEVHHLARGRGAAADTLKQFSNMMPSSTFVYAGIDLPGSGLLAGGPGHQISSRFTMLETNSEYDAKSDWARIVATFAHNTSLTSTTPEMIIRLAPLLHKLTGGRIGHLAALLADANIQAIEDRDPSTMREVISADMLRDIPLPYSAPVPDSAMPRRGSRNRVVA